MQDLCERHEKGVLHEHQRALQKYSVMKRQMMSATAQSKEQVSVEQLESRIVQVASALCPHRNLSLFFYSVKGIGCELVLFLGLSSFAFTLCLGVSMYS